MSYISKPKVSHPKSKINSIGLKRRDYEGVVSTLCAGCGHDSITAALIQAVFELGIEPHRLAKISGIGCSSRFPYYMNTFGLHTIHGRAPAVATGLKLTNPNFGTCSNFNDNI